MAANIDIDGSVVGESNVNHRLTTRRTKTAPSSLAAERMPPKRVNGFWSEGVAQKFDRDCPPAAAATRPENAMRGPDFLQRLLATWADQIANHLLKQNAVFIAREQQREQKICLWRISIQKLILLI
jgi:hypothetical protein